MHKLVVFSALLACAAAHVVPAEYGAAPLLTNVAAPYFNYNTYAAAPVVSTYAHAPVVKTYAAAPVVTAYAPAPIVKTFAPAPVVSTYAHAPVVSTYAHAPVVSTYAHAPVVKTVAAAPVLAAYAPAPIIKTVAPAIAVGHTITKTVHYAEKPVVTGYTSQIYKPDLGSVHTPIDLVTKQRVLAPARSVATITPQITQVHPELHVQKVPVDVPVHKPYISEVEIRQPAPIIAPVPVPVAPVHHVPVPVAVPVPVHAAPIHAAPIHAAPVHAAPVVVEARNYFHGHAPVVSKW